MASTYLRGAIMGLVCAFTLASNASAASAGKRIIEYGWDVPDTAYLREHVEQMEKWPFDGVVLRMYGARDGEKVDGHMVFRKDAWERDWFKRCLEDLRATRFTTFTDNFLLATTPPGTADWFSDKDWRAVSRNIAVLAWMARQGGLKGICFDPEPYGEHQLWAYDKQPDAGAHTFAQYRSQVRKRGAEFMRAIAGEYPDVTLFMLFGGSIVGDAARQPDPVGALQGEAYGLLPFFIDGMLDALPTGAFIVDGCELGYYMEERDAFLEAYLRMKQDTLRVISPENHDRYRARVLAGFGLYPDRNWNQPQWGWHTDDPTKNYYSPEKFKENLYHAVDISDRYVWVYAEQVNWWTGKGLPPGYEEAIREVRRAPKAAELAALIAKHQAPPEEVVAYLPAVWKFRKDDGDVGAAAGWYELDYDDSGWGTVRTDSQWFKQAPYRDMTGGGWGRAQFDVPPNAEGKQLYLLIGALDERGDIYLNGRLVYQRRSTLPDAFRLPFVVEVTQTVRLGQRNLLAVHAMAESTLGGVWKPSALLADGF